MKTVEYKCKFCGVVGTAEYDDTVELGNLEFWKSLLACNWCSDYHSGRLKLFRRITEICVSVNQARLGRFKDLSEIDKESQEMLKINTQKLARLVSGHFRIQNIWQEDFVSILLERPEHAWKSCEFYVKQRERDSRLVKSITPTALISHAEQSQPREML